MKTTMINGFQRMALKGIQWVFVIVIYGRAIADGMPPQKDVPAQIDENPTKGKTAFKEASYYRDTPAPAIDLPGVMRIDGIDPAALDFTKTRVVTMRQSVEPVFVSLNDPNTIILPFANPGAQHYSTFDVRKDASNLVFVFTKSQEPGTVFFYPPDRSTVFGLQLIPKDIPAQMIIVKNEEKTVLAGSSVDGNTYNAKFQRLFETVATGGTPPGFAAYQIETGAILLAKGALIERVRRYSSREMEIHAYVVGNPTDRRISLLAQSFDGPNVLGVSLTPSGEIDPGSKVTVVVISTRGEGGYVGR